MMVWLNVADRVILLSRRECSDDASWHPTYVNVTVQQSDDGGTSRRRACRRWSTLRAVAIAGTLGQ